jgi:hypothetical protein
LRFCLPVETLFEEPCEDIEVKPSDTRAKRYIEQYGPRNWKTDIPPAAVIEATLDPHIRSWLDAAL